MSYDDMLSCLIGWSSLYTVLEEAQGMYCDLRNKNHHKQRSSAQPDVALPNTIQHEDSSRCSAFHRPYLQLMLRGARIHDLISQRTKDVEIELRDDL